MKNVEWVDIQSFDQLGAFKWKAMNLEYKNADTHADARPCEPESNNSARRGAGT